jgi:uncharacterized protein
VIISGTLLNMATVLVGGILGTLLGNRLPERYQNIILQSLGLTTLLFAIQMMLKTSNPLISLGGLMLGALTGEFLGLERRLEGVGNRIQARMARRLGQDDKVAEGAPPHRGLATVSQAFVTSSLVFCVGPLTILGSIQNGLPGHDIQALALKSALDGFAAIAFAASLGYGVLFTVATIFVVQGGISVAAAVAGANLLSAAQINEMTAVGGLIVLGVGLKLLSIKNLPVANFLPALVYAPVIVWLLDTFGIKF